MYREKPTIHSEEGLKVIARDCIPVVGKSDVVYLSYNIIPLFKVHVVGSEIIHGAHYAQTI